MALRKSIAGIGIVAMLGLSMVTGVSADTPLKKSNDVDVTIKPASSGVDGLKLETAGIKSFGNIELEPVAKTYKTDFSGKFNVQDLRGTHDGWSLDVSASQFKNDNGDFLPEGTLTLKRDGIVTTAGNSELPKFAKERVAIDSGLVNVLDAPKSLRGSGAGVFEVEFEKDALEITVDATTAKAGKYESTLSWELKSTPKGN